MTGDDEDTANTRISFAKLAMQVNSFEEAQKQVGDSHLWKLVLKVLNSFSFLISDRFLSPRIQAYQERKNLPSAMRNEVFQSWGSIGQEEYKDKKVETPEKSQEEKEEVPKESQEKKEKKPKRVWDLIGIRKREPKKKQEKLSEEEEEGTPWFRPR